MRWFGLAAWVALSGCTTIHLDAGSGLQHETRIFGWVAIRSAEPAAQTALAAPAPRRIRATDITSLGLRLDQGFALGYVRERLWSVPPDCRTLIFVREREDLIRFIHPKLLQHLETTCTTPLTDP